MASSEGSDVSSVESRASVEVAPIRLAIGDELGTLRSGVFAVDAAESDVCSVGLGESNGSDDRVGHSATEGDRAWLCTGRKDGAIAVLDADTLTTAAQRPPRIGSCPISLSAFPDPRRPGLMAVYKDGHICLHRFRRGFWEIPETGDPHQHSKLKTVFSLKAAEDISTADLCRERHQIAFGGEDVSLSVCDLETKQLTFISKPPKNPYQLAKRLWVTGCCFIPQSHGQLLFGGNAEHELFLYDVRARKRPVFALENWRDARVTYICPEANGSQLWVANAMGFVDRFDLHKMSIRGSLTGQVAGSIRHLKLFEFASQSLIASVGLDRFLRVYSTEHRQLRQKLYCKYPLTAIEVLPYTPSGHSSEEREREEGSGDEEISSKRQRL